VCCQVDVGEGRALRKAAQGAADDKQGFRGQNG
jgi:hypothetical protein